MRAARSATRLGERRPRRRDAARRAGEALSGADAGRLVTRHASRSTATWIPVAIAAVRVPPGARSLVLLGAARPRGFALGGARRRPQEVVARGARSLRATSADELRSGRPRPGRRGAERAAGRRRAGLGRRLRLRPDGGAAPTWSSLPPALAGPAGALAAAAAAGATFLTVNASSRRRARRRTRCSQRLEAPARLACARHPLPLLDPHPTAAHRDPQRAPARAITSGSVAAAVERIRDGRDREGRARPRGDRRGAGRPRPGRAVRRAARALPVLLLLLLSARPRPPSSAPARSCWCAARAPGVATVALAGSTRRSADPAVDDHLGEQLLRSAKDRASTRSSSRRIERTLRPHVGLGRGRAPSPSSSRSPTSSTWRRRSAPSSPSRTRRSSWPGCCTRRRRSAASPGAGAAGGDRRARGDGPRLVRRARSAGWTRPRTASSASPCAAPCSATATPTCSPARDRRRLRPRGRAAPRPRSSSRRCCRCWPS